MYFFLYVDEIIGDIEAVVAIGFVFWQFDHLVVRLMKCFEAVHEELKKLIVLFIQHLPDLSLIRIFIDLFYGHLELILRLLVLFLAQHQLQAFNVKAGLCALVQYLTHIIHSSNKDIK